MFLASFEISFYSLHNPRYKIYIYINIYNCCTLVWDIIVIITVKIIRFIDWTLIELKTKIKVQSINLMNFPAIIYIQLCLTFRYPFRMIVKVLYAPIGLCLVAIRLGLLVALIFLRLILTYLQGAQSPITSSLTRFYLISCGVFIMAEGDMSKG